MADNAEPHGPAAMDPATRFDERYFQRFYFSKRTRAVAPLEYLARARLLAAHAALHGLKVKRILDLGAGAGSFLRALDAVFPGARAVGVEVSDYACTRYGWRKSSITEFRDARPYDLVVCHDVIQYLDNQQAARALLNISSLCRGMLFFMALTREDWEQNCDQSRTDSAVYKRPAKWYRDRLKPAFQRMGAGVYLARRAGIPLFALDAD